MTPAILASAERGISEAIVVGRKLDNLFNVTRLCVKAREATCRPRPDKYQRRRAPHVENLFVLCLRGVSKRMGMGTTYAQHER